MKATILAALFGIMTLGFMSNAKAANFAYPNWNGYRLDWCANFEQGCGKPAADLFCKKHGYPNATSFQIQPMMNVPTMTVGQNAICNPAVHRCDSFTYINCQETVKTFTYPAYNGYRLDWCRGFETGCGQPAAQLYCQKMGYSQVVNFQFQGPMSVPTMTVGSNAVCNPQFHRCDSFSFVQCKK